MEYENQLAGLLAFEWLKDVSDDPVKEAVDCLYSGRFDPRGMVSMWNLYKSRADLSPYPPDQLRKLQEKTRRAYVRMAPLRNPIVKSEKFLKMKAKLAAL